MLLSSIMLNIQCKLTINLFICKYVFYYVAHKLSATFNNFRCDSRQRIDRIIMLYIKQIFAMLVPINIPKMKSINVIGVLTLLKVKPCALDQLQ